MLVKPAYGHSTAKRLGRPTFPAIGYPFLCKRIILSIDNEDARISLIADASSSPEEILARKEIWKAVFQISEKTAKSGKEIMRLHFMEGMNAHQIARALDLPYSTVEYRLARILDALRKKEKAISDKTRIKFLRNFTQVP